MAKILGLDTYKNNEPPIKLEALIRSPFGSIPRFTCKQGPYCDLIGTNVIN